ncbi:MAG: CoA transferase, partial [Sulfolobus sp.]|nr:CoA transferase [Sulfolobus sp.]
FWINMCNAFNRNDLIDKQLDKEAIKELQEEIRKRGVSELMEMATKFDIPFQRVRSLDEIRKEFKDSYRGPELGEDTMKVLKELGYFEEKIRELERGGIIKIHN